MKPLLYCFYVEMASEGGREIIGLVRGMGGAKGGSMIAVKLSKEERHL